MLKRDPVWLALLLSAVAAMAAPEQARVKTGQKWADMDYGPFLTASIEAPQPATNIAYKGLAIPLADPLSPTRQAAVLFDTDLLRYAAGWTGGFVALKGVVFDGEHWAYPRIAGRQLFGNPNLPGWAKAGGFQDPREYAYGPLPRSWAHWKGLFLHGQKVVLAYSVGGTDVLELPSLEPASELTVIARTLDVGPRGEELTMQVVFDPARPSRQLLVDSLSPAPADAPARQSIVVLRPRSEPTLDRQAMERKAAEGLVGAWNFDQTEGDLAASESGGGGAIRFRTHTWADGHTGRALSLAGNGYGEMEGAPDFEFLRDDLTFTAWVKTSQDGTIISQTAPSGPWVPDGKSLFIRAGKLTFDVGWVGMVEAPQSVVDGQWRHVALTWAHEDGLATLHVDGLPAAERPLKPSGLVRGHVVRVGFTSPDFPQTPFFRGQIDDLRIYRRRLDASEIRLLANAPGHTASLLVGTGNAPPDAKWLLTSDGQVRLRLPAGTNPARFKVLLAEGQEESLPAFTRCLKQSAAPVQLGPLTRGGPPRWEPALTTRGQRGADTGPYAVDTITWPDDNVWDSWMRFGGFDFFRDGTRAAICSWSGDVWIVSGLDDRLDRLSWRRFATGLYQPLGLKIVDEQVYVLGRDQISRLHDLNGDGEADWYENFNNDTLNTEHFHEFALDLQTDAAGNFYYLKAARHARDALHPQHGTLMKVSRDGGRSEILAKGFRAPNGLGLGPQGEFFSTDQEGYWMPANRLNYIQPGSFHGNVWSWFPDRKPTSYDPPICWVHPKVDRSPSTMLWVDSDRWGPLADHLLSFSYGVGRIFLVLHETMDGLMQGGMVPLPVEFPTGLMRARFNRRDGQLYVCGLYGWAGNKTQAGGFYRVRSTGQPPRLPTEFHVVSNGLVLRFSDPLDRATATETSRYSVERWNYRWTQNYGSPDFKLNGEPGRDRLLVTAAYLSQDGRRLFLKLPGLEPAMQMHLQMNLKAADGTPIRTFIHHTVHRLGRQSGEEWLDEPALAAPASGWPELRHEAFGLTQTLRARDGPAQGLSDTRASRLLALAVPSGESPTPFLPPGPFVATWRGFIRLDLGGTYRFHPVGRGRVTVKVNDETVISAADLSDDATLEPNAAREAFVGGSGGSGAGSNTVLLKGGLNSLEATYESPPEGEAWLRLFWSAPEVPAEPIPPTVLVHEADDEELRRGAQRRLGRELFATRHCAKCHVPANPFAGGMPEGDREAPSLERCGNRFNRDWLSRWVAHPQAVVADATMPTCLAGAPGEVEGQARDLAAYLATLVDPREIGRPNGPSALSSEARQQEGRALYAQLGCVACHFLSGEPKLANDTRRSLEHVRAKYQAAALVDFLRAPGRFYPWTRMPDFQLSSDEALALAAFVLSRGEPAGSGGRSDTEGDPKRGRELVVALGCVPCHKIPEVSPVQFARPLDALAGRSWPSGCLAADAEQRGKAPDFQFRSEQLRALRELLEHDLASLGRDCWPEFANRQIEALRCRACHARENGPDTWSALEALAPDRNSPSANPYDSDETPANTIHRQRPPLTWTGEKLRAEWVERLLLGELPYKPRARLPARMPAFPAYARGLAKGLALDHGLSPAPEPFPPIDPALAGVGQALVQKGALGCVDCHALGVQPALAGADTTTINFVHVAGRLRKSYFDRYVLDPQRWLPGTMMPRFVNDEGWTGVVAHFGGDGRQQFEAIWHYLRTLSDPR